MKPNLTKEPNEVAVGKQKLWSKFFVLLAIVSVLLSTNLQFFNASTSLFVNSLGGTASFTGVLFLLFTIFALVTRIVSGRLVDKHGRRQAIIIGLVISILSSLACNLFPFLVALPILRIIQGIAYSLASTALAVAITDVVPKQRLGEGIGYFGLGNSLAQAVGPACALALIFGKNFKVVYYTAFALVVVGAALMLFYDFEKSDNFKNRMNEKESVPAYGRGLGKREPQKDQFNQFISSLFETSAIPYASISLLATIATSATVAFLTLYIKTYHIPNAGFYYVCSAICMVLVRVLCGKFSDKYHILMSLIPGYAFSILSFIFLLISPVNHIFFYAAGALLGLSYGITSPALNAVVIRRVPYSRRGAASGTFMISMDAGVGFGSIAWGFVLDKAGFSAMFSGCIIFSAMALALSIVLLWKSPTPINQG